MYKTKSGGADNGQVACEPVSRKCELVSESGSEHLQEEESYGQRQLPQLGAFGITGLAVTQTATLA
jgi:hypothetical protein